MRRGLFLSLDGIDGVGKTTQLTRLAHWLGERGHDVLTCRDPGGTRLGERIRQLLLGSEDVSINRRAEMLLYMASRAQLVTEVIEPALAHGRTVLSDRYLLANVVYQGYGGGLDVPTLWQIGKVVTGGVDPDLTLVLDLDPVQVVARKTLPPDRLEKESPDFHRRIREGFQAEAGKRPEQIRIIDASAPVEEVARRVCREVELFLHSRAAGA